MNNSIEYLEARLHRLVTLHDALEPGVANQPQTETTTSIEEELRNAVEAEHLAFADAAYRAVDRQWPPDCVHDDEFDDIVDGLTAFVYCSAAGIRPPDAACEAAFFVGGKLAGLAILAQGGSALGGQNARGQVNFAMALAHGQPAMRP